mgnify:CR=1 FL=1
MIVQRRIEWTGDKPSCGWLGDMRVAVVDVDRDGVVATMDGQTLPRHFRSVEAAQLWVERQVAVAEVVAARADRFLRLMEESAAFAVTVEKTLWIQRDPDGSWLVTLDNGLAATDDSLIEALVKFLRYERGGGA